MESCFLLGQDGLQIPGDGAVLQNEAGDADAAVFPNIRVNGAVLPQSQIHFKSDRLTDRFLKSISAPASLSRLRAYSVSGQR